MLSAYLKFSIFSLFIPLIFFTCSKDNSTNPVVNSTNGELLITYPTNNSKISGVITITSDITEGLSIDKVEFYIDGVLGHTSMSSPNKYQWNTGNYSDNTTHTIQLKGYKGNDLKVTSSTITVTVSNPGGATDTTAPTLSVINPNHGTTVSGSVNITVQASDDNGVKEVKIYIDGNYVIDGNTYTWITSNYTNGNHLIYAKAWDNAGNEGISDFISVIVNNTVTDATPPTVIIASPANNSIVSGTITVRAEANDESGINRIEIYVDGNHRSSNGSYEWNTINWDDKTYSIYSKAYDTHGNEGISSTISVITQNSVAIGTNFISNPGFEGSMANWREDNAQIEENDSYDGNKCIYINNGKIYQELDGFHYESGQVFRISLWHKGDAGAAQTSINFGQNYDFAAASDWEYFEIDISPNDAFKFSYLRIKSDDSIYIDNISFSRIN